MIVTFTSPWCCLVWAGWSTRWWWSTGGSAWCPAARCQAAGATVTGCFKKCVIAGELLQKQQTICLGKVKSNINFGNQCLW